MRADGKSFVSWRHFSPEIEWTNRHLNPWSVQIARILQDEIETGTIKSGDVMPSARQLHERFGVSEQTCGKVLRDLADKGYLHQPRKGGRYYCSDWKGRVVTPAPEDCAPPDKPDYKVFRFAINRPEQAVAAIRAKMTDAQWATFVNAVSGTAAKEAA
ncbi:GntR family transcriptional regulator [Streptomyces sp. NPDC016640]|uniref:GntR family transcriptional regulator n=1 Tax=Streptomyces sp. NPDC016640 TaxID=3364969 RepID=UPI0037021DA8